MKIIGRYSLFCDSVEVIPEGSLVALNVSAVTIDTYDRSPLCENSLCSLRLTVEGSKFGFKAGYPSFDKSLSVETAEEIVERLYKEECLDLREYEGVLLYGGHQKRTIIDID